MRNSDTGTPSPMVHCFKNIHDCGFEKYIFFGFLIIILNTV